MKNSICALFLTLICGCTYAQEAAVPANALTQSEKRDGWKLLFDGKTGAGWHSLKKDTFPAQGWAVEDGALHKLPKVRGGDLLSLNQYTDFDLRWEWKIGTKCNNGVKYFVSDDRGGIGHEYQMLDDANEEEGKGNGKFSTASFYAVLPPFPNKVAALKPAGEWNNSRVYVHGNTVEHYLNGQKVLEYTLGSPEVLEGVQKSKFKTVAHFGEKVKGHILLTDHNDEAWFRSIKILDRSKD